MKYVSSTENASVYIAITGGETYTVSREAITNRFSLATSANAPVLNEPLIDIIGDNDKNTLTLETSSSANYLCVYLTNTGENFDNALAKLKIVKGTSTDSYSPYNMGSIQIEKCNKNLFDKNDVINAYINIANGEPVSNSTFRASDFIKISGFSNIVVSGNYGASEGNAFYDKNKNFISGFSMGANTTKTAQVPSNAVYIRCTVRNDVLDQYQLEEGTIATTYIAHQSTTYSIYTQSPMRSIGEVRDDFAKIGGVWYERHKISRVVLDGTEEGWQRVDNTSYVKFTSNQIVNNCGANKTNLSNYFKTGGNEIGVLNLYSNNWLDVFMEVMSLADFKTWLSTHNTEVIYELAEPTLTECTSEQVSQLENIVKAKSYNGVTNLFSNDKVEPYLSCVALKNI